jgi:hypothetical protein
VDSIVDDPRLISGAAERSSIALHNSSTSCGRLRERGHTCVLEVARSIFRFASPRPVAMLLSVWRFGFPHRRSSRGASPPRKRGKAPNLEWVGQPVTAKPLLGPQKRRRRPHPTLVLRGSKRQRHGRISGKPESGPKIEPRGGNLMRGASAREGKAERTRAISAGRKTSKSTPSFVAAGESR